MDNFSALTGMTPDWADKFQKITGVHPETIGLKTEAEAQAHLMALERLKALTIPPPAISQGVFGKIGTRNEGIYPTK